MCAGTVCVLGWRQYCPDCAARMRICKMYMFVVMKICIEDIIAQCQCAALNFQIGNHNMCAAK